MVESWRYMDEEKTFLLVSGYVWDLKKLAKALGMPLKGPCWPYLLTRCANKNRPSRCDKWGKKGHENANSTAHKFTIDIEAAAKKYARIATPDEKKDLLKAPDWETINAEGAGRGRGRGDGRGRGRGREARGRARSPGRGGQRFGQPLSH